MSDPRAITDQPDSQAVSDITTQPDGNGVATVQAPAPLSPEGYRTTPDHTNTGWPPGVPAIVGNEACERFSYYGMRAILYIHLVALYGAQSWVQGAEKPDAMAATLATQTYHLFMAGVYALPMIGALIADRLAGKYRTILYLSLVYCLGHAVLSGGENLLLGVYLGLALIAIGSGGIKPCVSANVGDQFGKGNWHKLPTIYQVFYFSINFGSFFATLLIPLVQDHTGGWLIRTFPDVFGGFHPRRLGTTVAFAIPGVLMFLATLIFWLGRRSYVHVPARPSGRLGVLDVLCSAALFMAAGHFFASPKLLPAGVEQVAWLKWSVLGGVSLAFLALGLVLFNVRQKIAPDDGFLAVLLYTIKAHLGLGGRRGTAGGFWGPAVQHYGATVTQGPVAVVRVMSVLLLIPVFWALFDQHSSTWIEQARGMNLRIWGTPPPVPPEQAAAQAVAVQVAAVPTPAAPGVLSAVTAAWIATADSIDLGHRHTWLGIPNVRLSASQTAAANPALVMLLLPLMNLLYRLSERVGIQPTQLRRMTLGMCITALSFVATALLQQHIDAETAAGRPNSVWVGHQLWQYIILTIGEILVSITMLEFAYTQAPKKMKSTIMGIAMLTVAMGNVLVYVAAGGQAWLTAWVASNVVPGLSSLATFFWLFAVLCAVAAVLFGLRAIFYTYRDYAQE